MFDHFILGAQSQPRHLDDSLPSDPSIPTPPPPPTSSNHTAINDLAARLAEQTLYQRSHNELLKRFEAWQKISPDWDSDHDADMQTSEPMPTLPPSPTSPGEPCRRRQRQQNVQLQTCPTHLRDINALVEDMIVSNSQCTVAPPPTHLSSPPPSPSRPRASGAVQLSVEPPLEARGPDDVDEGFYEDPSAEEEEMKMKIERDVSLHRANAHTGIRKHTVSYKRCDELVDRGKLKVRKPPRMRRRMAQPCRSKE